ncbi:unnamed protein product [Cylicocyclus nassatus]|uniref:Uncharacterized protein n=1 Tax=Cylicocyclus nassatus TaxID=53992 RepID=A0AA36MD50_CYLNA|nr:unnamed protein product [Cylicocyclus nassatus]
MPTLEIFSGQNHSAAVLRRALVYCNSLDRINEEPTIWWTNLGKDDRERSKAFDMLAQARMDWAVFTRTALGRASGDVWAYVLNAVRANSFLQRRSV